MLHGVMCVYVKYCNFAASYNQLTYYYVTIKI